LIKSLFLTSILIKLGMWGAFRFKFGLEGVILVVPAQWALYLASFAGDFRWPSWWSSVEGAVVLPSNLGYLARHLI
jgi:hypothetical protein